MAGHKTSVKDIEVVNEKIYEDVARITKQARADVQDQVEFVGKYVAKIIGDGRMEAVMIPYFGKFRPKMKMVRAYHRITAERASGQDMIYKALKGKKVVDHRHKYNTNETTGNITGGQDSSDQQDMDTADS
jgi:hypothetical protein